MSTVNSSTASTFGHAFDQVKGLLITVVALLGPASLLAISMDQVWPLCLMETTFVLGTILGAARFVRASENFESDDADNFPLDRFLEKINAQSRAIFNN